MKRIFWVAFMTIVELCNLNAQETFTLTENFSVDFSSAKLFVSDSAKRERALLRGSGKIILNINNSQNISDEWKTSLKAACDIWSDYLEYGDSVIIEVNFTDQIDDDINLTLTRNKYNINGQNALFPPVLLRKISSDVFPAPNDAVVQINSKTNWCIGIGEEYQYQSKNLTLAFMQCIGRILGFGSSVSLNRRGQIELGTSKTPTIFDLFVKNEHGQRIIDYINDRASLRKFSEGLTGRVYFSTTNQNVELYTPASFESNSSLKYLSDTTSLMGYPLKQSHDLIVDNLTLNVLNELGWNFSTNKGEVKIVTNDMDNSGITSVYKAHTFHIEPTTTIFSSYNWKLILTDSSGHPVDVYSSSSNDFFVPQLSNVDLYGHTIEGDIRGVIVFEGISSGRIYKATYPLIFEQKPQIISAKVVSTHTSEDNPYYYDAVVEVRYVGSHYIHSYVEEENSSYLTSYFSSTPYFTRLNLKNIESWGAAWLNITVRNEYGTDNAVLDLGVSNEAPALITPKAKNNVTNITNHKMTSSLPTKKELYNLNGLYIGKYDENCIGIKSGIYLLRQIDADGNVIKTQKLLVK